MINTDIALLIEDHKKAFAEAVEETKTKALPLIKKRHALEEKIIQRREVAESTRFWQWDHIKNSFIGSVHHVRHGFVQKRIDRKFRDIDTLYHNVATNLTDAAGPYDTRGNAELNAIQHRTNPYSNLYPVYNDLLIHINGAIEAIDHAISNVQTAQAAKLAEILSSPGKNPDGSQKSAGAFHIGATVIGGAAQFDLASVVPHVQYRVSIVHNKAYNLQVAHIPSHNGEISTSGLGTTFIATQILGPGLLNNLASFVNMGILGDIERNLFHLRSDMERLFDQARIPVQYFIDFEAQRETDKKAVIENRKQILVSHDGETVSMTKMFNMCSQYYFGTEFPNSDQNLNKNLKRLKFATIGAIGLTGAAYAYSPVRDFFANVSIPTITGSTASLPAEPAPSPAYSATDPAPIGGTKQTLSTEEIKTDDPVENVTDMSQPAEPETTEPPQRTPEEQQEMQNIYKKIDKQMTEAVPAKKESWDDYDRDGPAPPTPGQLEDYNRRFMEAYNNPHGRSPNP